MNNMTKEVNNMSVPISKRTKSPVQFLSTGRKACIKSIEMMMQLPKSLRFVLSTKISELAIDTYVQMYIANSIYPTNLHEAQMRIDEFIMVRAKLYALSALIDVCKHFHPYKGKDLSEWGSLLDEQISLIGGVLAKDRKRYKSLPPKFGEYWKTLLLQEEKIKALEDTIKESDNQELKNQWKELDDELQEHKEDVKKYALDSMSKNFKEQKKAERKEAWMKKQEEKQLR